MHIGFLFYNLFDLYLYVLLDWRLSIVVFECWCVLGFLPPSTFGLCHLVFVDVEFRLYLGFYDRWWCCWMCWLSLVIHDVPYVVYVIRLLLASEEKSSGIE